MCRQLIIFLIFTYGVSDATGQNTKFWFGPGVGASTFGPVANADITIAKDKFAASIVWAYTADDIIFESERRSFSGASIGYLRAKRDRTFGVFAGIGFLTGDEIDNSQTSCFFGPCTKEMNRRVAFVARADALLHSSFIGLGVSPLLLIGNSEIIPGATFRIVLGKFR